jgi:cation diffusion facilitator CzcD-associated flavoprotein CzcO
MSDANECGAAFDPEALKRRYAEERAKRIRPEGVRQYQKFGGRHAHFLDDPFAEKPIQRDAFAEDVDVLIIGGGMSGVLVASHLRSGGIDSIRIVETASDFGGNWYWNRYPGAACDTESYIYLPLLEETGYIPTEKYAKAPEIQEQFRRIGLRYGLYERAAFQTKVDSVRWDEGLHRWRVETNRDDHIRAKFVCLCLGTYTRPKLPGIPGIETFQGYSFHTSRWDYAYTGGDSYGNLTKLRDKRVAIVGTGATAVQAVPHLGEWSGHLHVFQRTPSSVDVRANRATDPAWAASLEPGWQRRRLDNFEAITLGVRTDDDLVADGWTDNARRLRLPAVDGAPERTIELADFQKMEEIRRRVGQIVTDPATAEALKPYYGLYCKRPCFHDAYLQTFNRPNVTLIDTKGRGVDQITKSGLVVEGVEYPVDCIIYSTGFEVLALPHRAGEFSVSGVGGQSLEEKWRDGFKSLHGVFVHGFPNMMVVGALRDGGAAINAHFAYDAQAQHTAQVVARCLRTGVARLEVTDQAERAWRQTMEEKAPPARTLLECTPGYLNSEGAGGGDSLRLAVYGGGSIEYLDILTEWRRRHFERDMNIVSLEQPVPGTKHGNRSKDYSP